MINNRYIPINFIGSGRSRVFLCEDTHYYNRKVVLKILPKNAPDYEKKRFISEFEILDGLSFPTIIKVYEQSEILEIDSSESEKFSISIGSEYISMEYFDGNTLFDTDYHYDEQFITDIMIKLGSALFYLHQSNYIYLDLKPENILIKVTENDFELRLIDFGLCRENKTPEFEHTGGSVKYLAPEIIRGEIYDHRVDLYALGIIAYRLAYGSFPFSSENEIDIYRDHVELEFSFPAGNISAKLSLIIRKLLEKNPLDRYHSALQMFHDIDFHIINKVKYSWLPATKLFNRENLTGPVRKYLRGDLAENSILVLRGGGGSGKSAVLKLLARDYENCILIQESNIGNKISPEKALLSELLYNRNIYTKLPANLIEEIRGYINHSNGPDLEQVKSALSRIVSNIDSAIFIDDFNMFNRIGRELISELVMFARIKDLKVILAENAEFRQYSDDIPNIRIFNITNMMNDEVRTYIEEIFSTFFPKEHIYEIFIQNQNRYPSYFVKLFSSLIVEDIIQFTSSGPYIVRNATKLQKILRKENDIFNERLTLLTENKREILSVIALINAELDIQKLNYFFRIDPDEFERIIQQFSALGFVNYFHGNSIVRFISQSIKEIILANYPAIRSLHMKVAEIMVTRENEFSPMLIGDHFRDAGNDIDALHYYELELQRTKNLSAFQYQIDIVEKILQLRITEEKRIDSILQLCKLHFKMSNFTKALENVQQLNYAKLNDEQKLRYYWIVGNCRIKLGFPKEGIKVLLDNRKKLLTIISDAELYLALANAYFDMENNDEAKNICDKIVKNFPGDYHNSGGAYNLLGLIAIYANNDLNKARKYFEKAAEKYDEGNLPSKNAGVEVNLGNIFNMNGNGEKAVEHWTKAGKINEFMGNYEQQAKLQLSFGIYHFDNQQFDEAILKYNESLQIFTGLGDRNGEGLAYINLAEVSIRTCEFIDAESYINRAKAIFRMLNNSEELLETLYLSVILYCLSGDFQKSLKDIELYRELSVKSENIRHSHNYKYLLNLHNLNFDKKTFEESALVDNLTYFKEINEVSLYTANKFLLIRIYLQFADYVEASSQLKDDYLFDYCTKNKTAAAEYYILKALVYSGSKSTDVGKIFNYAEKAFKILQDQNVSLLTLEVTYLLARLYFDRGHEKLTNEYLFFTQSLVEHFYSKIASRESKKHFLEKKQIAEIIKYLENAGFKLNYE